MDQQLQINKEIAANFFHMVYNLKKPEEAISRFVGPSYRQHSPHIGDGKGPFIAYVNSLIDEFPEMCYQVIRQVAEGDLVVLHSRLQRSPTDRGVAMVNIVRLEDGKIVEHWDAKQLVPETAYHRNSMV